MLNLAQRSILLNSSAQAHDWIALRAHLSRQSRSQTLLCMHCMGTAPCNANQRAKQISQEIVGLPSFMQTNMQTNATLPGSSHTERSRFLGRPCFSSWFTARDVDAILLDHGCVI